MFKKIAAFILLVLLGLVIWQYDLVKYGLSQAKGQMKIILNAKPVEEYLSDPAYPGSLKEKIRLIHEIRDFAVDSLGLKGAKNYEKLYDQHGKPVLWVVTAAPPFKMEAKEWRFPIIGSFSYKGFFNYEWAQKELEDLQKEGLDAGIRTVNGWSTLGWLKDPILSGMLDRDAGDLADLIIHELTHTTLYIKDSVQFNENLATFIGGRGAEMFLEMKFGPGSDELRSYLLKRADRNRFAAYALAGADRLDSLYQTFDKSTTTPQKREAKASAISAFIAALDTVHFKDQLRYAGWFDDFTPDNTYFLSFMRYRSNVEEIEAICEAQFEDDLQRMIAYFKERYRSL